MNGWHCAHHTSFIHIFYQKSNAFYGCIRKPVTVKKCAQIWMLTVRQHIDSRLSNDFNNQLRRLQMYQKQFSKEHKSYSYREVTTA